MSLAPLRLCAVLIALVPLTAWAHSFMDLSTTVKAPPFLRAGQTERIDVVASVQAFDAAIAVIFEVETSAEFTGFAAPSGWRCTRAAKLVSCSIDELPAGPHTLGVDVAVPASGTVMVTAAIISIASDDPDGTNNDHLARSSVYAASSCTASAPAAVSASSTSSGSVELHWSAVPGATSYDVLAGIDGETPHVAATTTATQAALRLGGGEITWLVRAALDGCPAVESAPSTFTNTAPPLRLAVTSLTSELFGKPVSIAFDGDFALVADAEKRRIFSFYVRDRHVFPVDLEGEVAITPLAADGGLAVGPGRFLYIAEPGRQLVRYTSMHVPHYVLTVAGSPNAAGAADGTGPAARVRGAVGVATDSRSRIYISDSGNHTIRRGVFDVSKGEFGITTFAGAAGQSGFANGAGSSARFSDPAGLAVDAADNLIVADRGNHVIRRIDPSGNVTTIAGVAGEAGHRDGAAAQALFNRPSSVAVDAWGHILVTEEGNHTVRKIAPNGRVTTVAGQAGSAGDADGTGVSARFNGPSSVAVSADGTVWIADPGNGKLRRATFVPAAGPKRRSAGK
jgi:NHL repeat